MATDASDVFPTEQISKEGYQGEPKNEYLPVKGRKFCLCRYIVVDFSSMMIMLK